MGIQDIQLSQKDAYLSNPNLKRANTQIEWSEDKILEFLKCKEDPVYFAKNHLKIVSLDHGLVPFNLYPFQEKLIQNFHRHRFNICKMPRQTGKKLSLDTPIPTPSGWTTIENLRVGDIIFGRDGNKTKVIDKSPIHKIDTYEIEFDNGEVIKACSEHLWKVSHSDWYHKEKVLNTKQILEKFNNLKNASKRSSVYINICESIDLPEIELPIDPYTLGCWLGDGSRSDGAITGLYEDIKIVSNSIPLDIIKEIKCNHTENVWRFYFKGLKEITHELGLNKEKFIPEKYLRSSTNQRLELLKGLMDTDGSVSPNGACEFYQKDGKLLYQVRELLSSLGIKSRIRYKKIPGYSGTYGTISFCTKKYDVFTLPRKLERQKKSLDHPKNKRIYIEDIRKIETEPMQCISVDNNDHLFLCGKTFIPTHNSSTTVAYLLHYALFNDSVNIAILANKATTARDLLQRLQLAYENLPKWMQQGVLQWNRGSLELENGSKIMAASTSASAVRGGSYNIIFLDEFAFIPNHIADDFFASVYPTISSGKTTKVIIVSCVTDDTFVLTPNGIYEMSDFIDYNQEENPVKGYEVSDYQVYGHGGIKNGNILVNSGYHDTKIIYSQSSSVECSLRHPWFVCDNGIYDWKKTSELNGDEYVAIEYGHDIWGNDNQIEENEKYDIKEITSDFAYFLGLYISKGSSIYEIINDNEIKYRGIAITCTDNIKSTLKSLNLNYNYNNVNYIISSPSLCEIMINLGFDLFNKSKEKEIPKKLFKMSKENIISLIQGIMDSNGTAQKSNGIVSITSKSQKLIKQIRFLLNNFGILSSYYKIAIEKSPEVKVYSYKYKIELSGEMSNTYYDLIGFKFQRKQFNEKYLIKSSTKNSCDVIPYSKNVIFSLKNTHPEDYNKIIKSKILAGHYRKTPHFSRKFLLKHKKFFLSLNNEVINNLYEFISENIKWEKINKIQDSKNKVYDFSLKETGDEWCHSVLFNNILGSNTPRGMNHFYRMWHDAERGKNGYVPTEVHWSDVPGRDEKWKEETIANTSAEQFRIEFESVQHDTLINVEMDGVIKEISIGDLYKNLYNKSY